MEDGQCARCCRGWEFIISITPRRERMVRGYVSACPDGAPTFLRTGSIATGRNSESTSHFDDTLSFQVQTSTRLMVVHS
eukprot:708789-Prymnesium_polylepis.1